MKTTTRMTTEEIEMHAEGDRNVCHLESGGTLAYVAGSGRIFHARLRESYGIRQLDVIDPDTGEKMASTGIVNADALHNAVSHLPGVRRIGPPDRAATVN